MKTLSSLFPVKLVVFGLNVVIGLVTLPYGVFGKDRVNYWKAWKGTFLALTK